MRAFQGSMLVQGDSSPLPATVRVGDGRLSIMSRSILIGDWRLEDLTIRDHPGRVVLGVEGEELILDLPEQLAFVQLTGATRPWAPETNGNGHRKIKLHRKTAETPPTPASKEKTTKVVTHGLGDRLRSTWAELQERVPDRFRNRATAAGGIVLLLLLVFAPDVLAAIVSGIGFLAALAGGIGMYDHQLSARFPNGLRPERVLVLGAALVVIGVIISLVR